MEGMKHFDIVLVLASLAVHGKETDKERAAYQVARLRDLLKESDLDQSEKLNRVLARKQRKERLLIKECI